MASLSERTTAYLNPYIKNYLQHEAVEQGKSISELINDQLRKLSAYNGKHVSNAIDSLAEVPWPAGVKKMAGANAWRTRVGEYRVVHVIKDKQLIVEVIRLGHRREIYR